MRIIGAAAFCVYLAAIVAANWLIVRFGLVTLAGLTAPAGVFAAGITFPARDLTQRYLGKLAGFAAIIAGSGLTFLISAQLAVASGVTFLISETADMTIYTPLQKRYAVSVLVSSIAAAVIDSLIFLQLAGISYSQALAGQIVFKCVTILCAGMPVTMFLRARLA